MRKSVLITLILIFMFFGLGGCSLPRQRIVYVEREVPVSRTEPAKIPTKPPGFDIAISIQNYTIVNHKILNIPANLGKMRFAGKWRYPGGNLLYKFKSENYPDYYWILSIPENTNSKTLELRAIPRLEPGTGLEAVVPPKQFRISISIRGGKVENQSLIEPQPGWGIFYFTKWEKPIATLKNDDYPKCEWKGRWPTVDGDATATMVLVTENCYEK